MKERIEKVIQQTIEINEVSDDISMINCEKWDSLNHLNLMVALETEFDIIIEPEMMVEMRSLDEVIASIATLV